MKHIKYTCSRCGCTSFLEMTYGDRVKADRESRGMSQQQYAEFVGVTRMSIYRAENDKAGHITKSAIRRATGVKEDEKQDHSIRQ